MKIGLVDVDGHNFPNIALMKLSAWHKSNGDRVGWYDPFDHFDRVYKSKVFGFTPDFRECIQADEVVCGGTGYAIRGGSEYDKAKDKPLPYEVEHTMPDYSIYNITDTAYGFLTRGCPRRCPFCIVGNKEGCKSVKVADLAEFWNGERNITLCDPNILACRDCGYLIEQLARSRAWVDFNQGLDARLMTEEKAKALGEIKVKNIHFAWDDYKQGDEVLRGLELYQRHAKRKPNGHNCAVYTLVNFDTTIEQDLERIYTLRRLGFWAYVMVYNKPKSAPIYRKLQRWVNNRFIFAKCDNFNDYLKQTS